MSEALFVVVNGPPGSGKSTLARPVAGALELPLVAKDTIKDALMSVLPVADVDASQALGRAAIAAMFAVAAESPGAVLDCNLRRSAARPEIRQLPGCVVEVFCRCDREVARARYAARTGSRHPGHFDGDRSFDALWNDDTTSPVAGGWPVVEVDTNVSVNVVEVLARIRSTRFD